MLCPFCLDEVRFDQERATDSPASVYFCPSCPTKEPVPPLYVREYHRYPPKVVSAIGFRQHGKTVYFASLFHAFGTLSRLWGDFHVMAPSEADLDTIYANIRMLDAGNLPDSTLKNFPRPTMVRVVNMPTQPNCTLLCYDIGGESFERASQLVQHAHFVRRARTAMLLVSVSDMEDAAEGLHQLLNTYVVGLEDLGAHARQQHLVVTYTKGDEMMTRFQAWGEPGAELQQYLMQGSIDGLVNLQGYLRRMHRVSDLLRAFTRDVLGAHAFLNLARQRFRSVSFSLVSALGTRPHGRRLSVHITPRRVFDPLLWLMRKSEPEWRRAWRRLWSFMEWMES